MQRDTFNWPRPSNYVVFSEGAEPNYISSNTEQSFLRVFDELSLAKDDHLGISFSGKKSPYSNVFDGMFVVYDGNQTQEWLQLSTEYKKRLWALRSLSIDYLSEKFDTHKHLICFGVNFDHEKIPLVGLKLGQSVRIFHEHVTVYPIDELLSRRTSADKRLNVDVDDYFLQDRFDRHGFSLTDDSFFKQIKSEDLQKNPIGDAMIPRGIVFEVMGGSKSFNDMKFQESYDSLLHDFKGAYDYARSKLFYEPAQETPAVLANKDLLSEIIRLYRCTAACKGSPLRMPRTQYAYSSAFYPHDGKLYFAMRPRVHCGSGSAEIFGISMRRYLDEKGFYSDLEKVEANRAPFVEYLCKNGMRKT